MIKYSSIDIIKRAEQLADLENSDFISDYEKLTLLNENWTMLYQKIINSGDKTFIKKIKVKNGTYLPPDFYQMSDIYTTDNHNPITKRNSLQYEGYDIIDGVFSLSKRYENMDITVEYYPAPKTLYLKNKTSDSDYDINTVACNDSLYYTSEKYIKDLFDPEVNTEAQFNSDNVAMFNNAAISYDYVEKPDVKAMDIHGGYRYFSYDDYKTIYDVANDIKIYDGCNEGKILSDDVYIHFPETPILSVAEYPTVQDVIDAGYCPKYICNNTNVKVAMKETNVLARTGKHALGGTWILQANTEDREMATTGTPNRFAASKVTLTYNGQTIELVGKPNGAGNSIFSYVEDHVWYSTVLFSLTDTMSNHGHHTYKYTNNTDSDIEISNVEFQYIVDTHVWLPTVYSEVPTTITTSSDSYQLAMGNSLSWIQTTIGSQTVNIPDTTESSSSGWSSKELAMQVFIYDANTMATAVQADNNMVPFIIDNEAYLLNKTTKKIIDFYGNEYDTFNLAFAIGSYPSWIYSNKGYDTLYAVYDNQIVYYNRLNKVASYNCDEFRGKAVMNGKDLYAVTKGNKLIKTRDKVDIIATKYIPVTIINGTKVLTHKPLTSRYFVEGTVEDTVLDFSNNVSYIMLSYLLAIAFKSKQGADITLLANQLAVAEQQFYDSINKDINAQYTIKNVYSNRRFI